MDLVQSPGQLSLSAPVTASRQPGSSTQLNLDIWFLVFKEIWLGNLFPDIRQRNLEFEGWLRSTRLVCRDFDAVTTPLVYRHFQINDLWEAETLLNKLDGVSEKAKEAIKNYTTQLKLPSLGDDKRVFSELTTFVKTTRVLNKIWWDGPFEFGIEDEEWNGYINTMYLEAFMHGRPHCHFVQKWDPNHLIIDDCRWRFGGTLREALVRPQSQSKEMTSLSLEAQFDVVLVNFVPIGRVLPPMESLSIDVPDLKLAKNRTQMSEIWDFERVRHLTLKGICIANFFKDGPVLDLGILKSLTLHIDEELYTFGSPRRALILSAMREMRSLRALDVLYYGWWEWLPIERIGLVGATLQKLILRDNEVENRQFQLGARDIYLIRDYCPVLCSLGLDVDFSQSEAGMKQIFKTLSRFHTLTTLDIYAGRSFIQEGQSFMTLDPEFDVGLAYLQEIMGAKLSKKFEFLALHLSRQYACKPPNWYHPGPHGG